MAATYVGVVASGTASDTTTTVTVPVSTASTAGNAIIVVVGDNESGGTNNFVSCTDTQGNSYTLLVDQGHSSAFAAQGVWIARDATALSTSDSITVTAATSNGSPALIAFEFAGLTGDMDATVSAEGTTTSYDTGSTSVPAGDHLLFSVAVGNGSKTFTPSGAGTWIVLPLAPDAASKARTANSFYQLGSGGGTLQNVGGVSGSSANWVATALSLPAAGTGSGSDTFAWVGSTAWVASDPWPTASGTASGSASGGFAFTGSASGTAAHAGAASGAVAWSGSASGTATHRGTSSAGFAVAGTAVGTAVHDGSAAAGVTWAGTATGVATHQGAAAAGFAWSGTAAGATIHGGTASAGVAWTGVASGSAPVVGQHQGHAAASLAFTGTASGAARHLGTAQVICTFTGTAAGTAPAVGAHQGSAVGGFTFRAVAAGPIGLRPHTYAYATLGSDGTATALVTASPALAALAGNGQATVALLAPLATVILHTDD